LAKRRTDLVGREHHVHPVGHNGKVAAIEPFFGLDRHARAKEAADMFARRDLFDEAGSRVSAGVGRPLRSLTAASVPQTLLAAAGYGYPSEPVD